jgi:voltage-gated potassium channel
MIHPFRRLLPAILVILSVILFGIMVYTLVEKWTLLEAVYMVITTLFAVGFQEMHPLSPIGRICTIFIIVGGVGSAIYAAGQAVEIIVEGEMSGYQKRKRMEKIIREMEDHFIICGFGRVGHQVAQVFEASRIPFVVIDSKKETLEELEPKGFAGIVGDATNDSVLMAAGIRGAKGLVACSDSDVANVYVTLSARVLNPKLHIVARAGVHDTEKKLIMAGANKVISPYFISGIRMAALATRPVTSDFLDLVTHGGQVDFSIYDVTIPENSPLIQKSVGEAEITKTSGALVLAVRKTNAAFELQPNAVSRFEQGDAIIALGTQEQFEVLEKMVQPKH